MNSADRPTSAPSTSLNRRQVLQNVAAGSFAAAAAWSAGHVQAADQPATPANKPLKGHIKHSICQWCFEKHWDMPQLIRVAKQLGCVSIELLDPKHWPLLKENGLTCAIASSHGFVKGLNNPAHWDYCLENLHAKIDESAAAGVPSVITFTGMSDGISLEAGARNCVTAYKKIVDYAEQKKVTLCLEMLNTRDDTHPMKGHPGYQGNHVDYCVDIIKQVDSPRLKLLFDVYHVQIMDGDVIRRIHQNKEYLGHIHTAGNPGRGELDGKQEISYTPVMQALVDVGYTGYVGHEFIPTRDPQVGLREAVAVCDV